jgi:hypothetical protein
MAQRARRTYSFVFGEFGFIEHRATSTSKIPFGKLRAGFIGYSIFLFLFLIFEYRTAEYRISNNEVKKQSAWRKEQGALIPSFSENSDSSNIEPLQHSKFPSASSGQALLDIQNSSFFNF